MKRSVIATLAILLSTSATFAQSPGPNTLTAEESKLGFELLFDGRSFDGWKHKGNWKIENSVLTRSGRGGSLVYSKKKVPDDFELRFEWKVGKGSNSGIYYRPTQYEYQILDNKVHNDGKNPRTSAASLYFCMQPSHDATRPVGQWNTGRIICKGSVIQHWLNGRKVVGFDYRDPQWKSNVDMLNQRGGNLKARGAYLSLQDHGDPVWYRSIRMRKLNANDKLDRSKIVPAKISAEVLQAEAKKLKGIVARREAAKARKKTKTKSK